MGYLSDPQEGSWFWSLNGEHAGVTSILWNGERLTIDKTPCRFGGQRWWFRCRCGRNVSKLYSPDRRPWACRTCHNLSYRTRQIIPRHRLILRAQRIRQRLGGTANLVEDFPPRPKGMHQKRYRRLRAQYDRLTQKALGMSAAWLDGVNKRL
jgi:hypothetical protein